MSVLVRWTVSIKNISHWWNANETWFEKSWKQDLKIYGNLGNISIKILTIENICRHHMNIITACTNNIWETYIKIQQRIDSEHQQIEDPKNIKKYN